MSNATFTGRLLDLPAKLEFVALAPLPLRAIVGYGFMEHGFAKLARGLDAFPALLQALGVPFPKLMGLATIAVEIFGGLAVLLGVFVPLAAIPMATVLLTAALTVHLRYGFSSIKLQAITPEGARFGPPGYGPTCSISLASPHSCSAARASGRSTRGWPDAAGAPVRDFRRCPTCGPKGGHPR